MTNHDYVLNQKTLIKHTFYIVYYKAVMYNMLFYLRMLL
jgi:hypothetical protein